MPKPEPALLVSVEAYLTVSLRLNTRRRRLAFACAASFILTYLAAWFVSQVVGFPTPFVQDEFCYLLAGETFASGHLATRLRHGALTRETGRASLPDPFPGCAAVLSVSRRCRS